MTIYDLDTQHDTDISMGRMHTTLFDREMEVILLGKDESLIPYAEQCADYFNHMPQELLAALRTCSLRYCEDMRRCAEPALFAVPDGVGEEHIWDYVRPNSFLIEPPKDAQKLAFGVEFSCDWEPEHGMEWVLRDGHILYVGDFMSVSPWYAASVYERECRSYIYEDFSIA